FPTRRSSDLGGGPSFRISHSSAGTTRFRFGGLALCASQPGCGHPKEISVALRRLTAQCKRGSGGARRGGGVGAAALEAEAVLAPDDEEAGAHDDVRADD